MERDFFDQEARQEAEGRTQVGSDAENAAVGRIRRPIGDERVGFSHQNLSNPILMNCPDQISMEFCLLNPSIILPTARAFRDGALLKPPLGLLARLLAEKIAFQEAFKKRLNFTSILTSILIPLGSILRPSLLPKIDQKSI